MYWILVPNMMELEFGPCEGRDGIWSRKLGIGYCVRLLKSQHFSHISILSWGIVENNL